MGKPQENRPQMLCVFLIYISLRGLWGVRAPLTSKSLSYEISPLIPSSNQIWQWKVLHYG